MVDFVRFDADAVRAHERRLPHWRQDGVMYFVTFRLGDSVPQGVLAQWDREREAWLRHHPEPLTPRQEEEFGRIFTERMERYLDAGHGSCVLANPLASEIVESSLLHFDGDRYFLGEYVTMPNHVHLLVIPKAGFDISAITHSWKSFTGHAINKALGRVGCVWQEESYDHIVRSVAQRCHYEEYTRQNPVVSGLRPGAFRLGVGDAGVEG